MVALGRGDEREYLITPADPIPATMAILIAPYHLLDGVSVSPIPYVQSLPRSSAFLDLKPS